MSAWTTSTAAALTGRSGGPALEAPTGVVERIQALGAPLDVDVVELLGWRAEELRLARQGSVSAGGAAHLLPTVDGWICVNLPRDDDVASIPAWLEAGEPGPDHWAFVRDVVATRRSTDVLDRAVLLGLPVSVVGETDVPAAPGLRLALDGGAGMEVRPCPWPRPDRRLDAARLDGALVVDLSSLWAGPLCARLLADRGARVVKVESATRPDGARLGPRSFWDRLHHDTESVVLDFASATGRAELAKLVHAADVVIEASRRRALDQLGLAPSDVRPSAWVSINGHGRGRDRVAFGDDAAAAGGLVAWPDDGGGPCFVADAVADPLTGVAAAVGVVDALSDGGSWLVDMAMARVAAYVAGPTSEPWFASPTRQSVR